ncbi:hypothetical protein [Ktedonospora formicarum]|uniref:Uncharacterized protein n=1 Tax=Ktedonospora formicarum TaxID=2778364 RepID=A0A8J3MRM3_9CHLR|nr:hypothetical protein [Ktedonospora formicarum]GHO45190.1 hypothetical protein KSX_33530 [Ktedonospora formicarum]
MDIEFLDNNNLIGKDLGRELLTGIYADVSTLGKTIGQRIMDRTPQRAGSLVADEITEINTDINDPLLARWYTGQTHQVATSGHTYAQFVEGPPMPTGTDPIDVGGVNGMWATPLYVQGYYGANMYGEAATGDDMDYITNWFEAGIQNGIERMLG